MFANSRAFSYAPGGLSPNDFPQNRRPVQYDLQRQPVGVSRPNGRVIYMQRKEYSESLNQPSEDLRVRVEHLFTGDLDGSDMRTLEDCVAKLKVLDVKGRLWPQDMIMDVQGGYLLLSDIETKDELESFPLSAIVQTNAVLDSCAYNSLLTVAVQQRNKLQVFMFQCEETGAELLKADLDKAVNRSDGPVDLYRIPTDLRRNMDNVVRQQSLRPSIVMPERIRTPSPDLELDYASPSRSVTPTDVALPERRSTTPQRMEVERNTEILNHVINDIEIFLDKIEAISRASAGKKKSKALALPPWQEYVSFLQKVKYGFNLLGQLGDTLSSPTAGEFVRIFFAILQKVVTQYPGHIPNKVVSPLLTDTAVELMEQAANAQEDQLWRALGESWNVPRSRWPSSNVEPYIPQFYNGWQPPAPTYIPPSTPSRWNNVVQHDAPRGGGGGGGDSSNDNYMAGRPQQPREEPVHNGSWDLPPVEPTLRMRAMYDFMARNSHELSIMAGEEVQVIRKSSRWWLVRNSRGEEGNVPQSVLEHQQGGANTSPDLRRGGRGGGVTLDMSSSPAEVKAWLRHKGFSNITVSSLGVLNGRHLLQMNRNEMKAVCPEEGGKVFFQLQAVKSSIALASEQSGRYNGHY
ncbi:unnamed protein product [Ophioblennius macclurei]